MAQKATSNKNGAKKAAAAKPVRKAVRAHASTTKAAKPKSPPPKAPPKGRVKAKAPSTTAKGAPKAAAKPPTKGPAVTKAPVSAAKVAQPKVHATKVLAKTAIAAMARQAVPPAPARTMPAAVAKAAGQRIIAPAAGKLPVGKPVAAAPPPPAAPKKPVSQRHGFKTGEWIVYPAHGVGRVVTIEEQEIAGISLELFVITFEKDKMTLRVPTGKSQSVGMRKLAEEGTVKKAMDTLKGRARVKRTMWSRRAQEYEAKINSGDLIAIAEVVRDLYRSESQPEQSYSERQLYEAALDRMAREIAAVEKLDERGAVQRITEVLSKSAKGRRLAAEEEEIKAA
jgi:CarD family transcriptional regulator